jgi:hypothetical protein
VSFVDLDVYLLTYGEPVAQLPNPPVATATDAAATSSSTTASTVTFDTTATSLWSLDLTIIDSTGVLVPTTQGGLLLPAGNELAVFYNEFPVGIYPIVVNDITDTVDTSGGSIAGDIGPVMEITGYDRSFLFSANTPTTVSQTPNGMPLGAATYQLLHNAVPWLDSQLFQLFDEGYVLPQQIIDSSVIPWQLAQSWWNALGGLLYMNAAGQIVGYFPPANPPVSYLWNRGGRLGNTGSITGIEPNYDRTTAYNGVTVQTTNAAGTNVQATAWDTNPASPTYYLGPFGQCPAPALQSDIPGTAADCLRAAIQLLPAYLGLASTVTVTLVPDPTISPYAIASVISEIDGVSGLWQIQSGQLTLDYTASEELVLVPAGQPVNWGQAATS